MRRLSLPEAEALTIVRRFKSLLMRLDSVAAAEMIRAYGPIWRRIEREVEEIAADAVQRGLSRSQVLRLQRLESLLGQVEAEVRQFAFQANGHITAGQRAALGLSRDSVRRSVEAALPRGVSLQTLVRLG